MSPDLEVAIVSGIIIPVIAIAVTIFLSYKPEKIRFKLIRRDSSFKVPFESNTALEVSHPEKIIENCRLIYDGKELIAEESNLSHVTRLSSGISPIPYSNRHGKRGSMGYSQNWQTHH